jgi:hypothetical protein
MSKNREITDMIRHNLTKGKAEFEEFGDLTEEQAKWCFRMMDRLLLMTTTQQDYIDALEEGLAFYDQEDADHLKKLYEEKEISHNG